MSKPVNGLKIVGYVYEVPSSAIQNAEYNPADRTKDDSVSLRNLAKSLAADGQIVPVVLRPSGLGFTLVEGHRRTKATALNGGTTVKAIILDADEGQAAHSYEVINGLAEKHKGYQSIESWLTNPLTVKKDLRYKLTRMEALIGRPTVQKMVKHKKGWCFYWHRGVEVAKWMGLAEKHYNLFINYLLDVPGAETNCRWLKEHKQTASITEICQAITEGRAPRIPALFGRAA